MSIPWHVKAEEDGEALDLHEVTEGTAIAAQCLRKKLFPGKDTNWKMIDENANELHIVEGVNGKAVAPGVSNDNTEGFKPLSLWVDETANKAYVNLDATTGAAIWADITAGAGGLTGGGVANRFAIWDAATNITHDADALWNLATNSAQFGSAARNASLEVYNDGATPTKIFRAAVSSAVDLELINDQSPGAVGQGSTIDFRSNNSTPALTTFGQITMEPKVVTAGAEDGKLIVGLMDNGTVRSVYEVDEDVNSHSFRIDNADIVQLFKDGDDRILSKGLVYETEDSSGAAVSGAATGRIRYDEPNAHFQASMNSGIYHELGLWDKATVASNDGAIMFGSPTGEFIAVNFNELVWDNSNFYLGVGTTTPESTVEVEGSFATAISNETGTLTLDDTHHTIIMDNAAAATVNLPAASGCTGRIYVIKRESATGATRDITIDANGAETIDGATTYILNQQYESVTIQSDGTEWWVI